MLVVPAGSGDVEAATDTIDRAFAGDPVWGVALHGPGVPPDFPRLFWRFYVEGAGRYDGVRASEGAGTVSVWIPPDGTEVTQAQEAALRELSLAALGRERADALFELWDRFEEQHPDDEPHAYLSLLATRPDLAGHGYGQAHLAIDLERWDAADVPTYLESTNPRNIARYERQGFSKIGQFDAVLDDAVVTTMWRAVGG